MNNEDRKIKEILIKGGVDGASFSPEQKVKMVGIMSEELSRRPVGLWQKLKYRYELFLETTYEISLTPVIGLFLIAALAVNINFLSSDNTKKGQNDQPVYYARQITSAPDGSMQIVYVPMTGEVK
ncbi:hypothetical protein MFMK1_003425 [Metallumcola ferriviriculae]|uniref:Uncharacterized protein n=1 Tax=Metallumcola ferriviriculae TaxID=3039180 RepID=A0AAU0UR17_9FIRM|nr:hypothetical protein MFMK1_003425 [Desulfitibacteraceae bacterium MK1]